MATEPCLLGVPRAGKSWVALGTEPVGGISAYKYARRAPAVHLSCISLSVFYCIFAQITVHIT